MHLVLVIPKKMLSYPNGQQKGLWARVACLCDINIASRAGKVTGPNKLQVYFRAQVGHSIDYCSQI